MMTSTQSLSERLRGDARYHDDAETASLELKAADALDANAALLAQAAVALDVARLTIKGRHQSERDAWVLVKEALAAIRKEQS